MALLALLICPAVWAQDDVVVTGGELEYVIQPGDYLYRIGARLGVDARTLAHDNGIPLNGYIHPGRRLYIDNRHIVPEGLQTGIVINLPQRMLFLFLEGRLAAAYPVGLGRPTWQTPTGEFHVRRLEVNKDWVVPKSIQDEMRREGQVVRARVPPGPDNPLGKHWIGLSRPGYGIHGTIAPASIYQFVTHGCIRLHPDDVAVLFERVWVNMPVRIIYNPILLTRTADGRVVLEVHQDIYQRGDNLMEEARAQARRLGLESRVDWNAAAAVIEARAGVARDVTADGMRQ